MPRRPLFLLCACLCTAGLWYAVFSLLSGLQGAGAGRTDARGRAADTSLSISSGLVDRALAARPPTPAQGFTGAAASPFKTAAEARREERPPAQKASAGAKPRLVLKGVLYKSNPLSILEDGGGKTYIAGVGDTVLKQVIVAIKKNTVTLRDGHLTYELIVKE
jgi:hypothetical protein